jgi:2-iminobutanoate/2-iminopropanoate deaminase
MIETVQTDRAPQAIGPYAQAIKAQGLIYTSGQIALTPEGEIVEGDVRAQARQVLRNLEHVLKAAGSRLDRVVKTTIYLADMNDFVAVNEVYADVFGTHKPARSTVEVSRLPKDVKVEIDCIALA